MGRIKATPALALSALLLASCAAHNIGRSDLEGVSPLGVTDPERVALAQYCYSSASGDSAELPQRLLDDRRPRMVFVTAGDGKSRGRVFEGYGRGVMAALDAGLRQISSQAPPPIWCKVDVVEEVAPVSFPIGQPAASAGLYGLMFAPGDLNLLPQEVVVGRLIDSFGLLREGRYGDLLALRGRSGGASPAQVSRFTAMGAFADADGATVLYRDHSLFDAVTRTQVVEAAAAGGRYLTGAVKHDGRFVYLYRPKSDEERSGYNVLRHAGTTYAMFELAARVPDAALMKAGGRALAGLLELTEPCPAPASGERCVVEDGIVKLGGNALAILALTMHSEVTGDRQHLPLMRSLGRYLLAVQQPSGEFWPHMQRLSDGAAGSHVSVYYPGEALLALMRLHRLDPGGPWLDAADRGARWLIEVRDVDLPRSELPHDHWLLYALNELYRARPSPLVLEHAMAIARAIARSQNTGAEYPDWRGSFYRPPRSTPTSTRIEGLNAAFLLARDFGSNEDADIFRRTIDLAVRYLLQNQFRPEVAIHLPNPVRALGGFRADYNNYEIRIDYVQHAISALLGYERILASAASPEPEPMPLPGG